jgi:YkoY family integral membrane protein
MLRIVITAQDLVVILFLIFLEGILSIDNALVLALLARGLPKEQQRRALTYGLAGAVVFRLASLFIVTQLMKWVWVKFVGGGYLIFVALKHFLSRKEEEDPERPKRRRSFWGTVVVIELTDIAFAVDSILAAVALSPKFWVVFTGGFLGVILMRFAATVFLRILDRFPAFEETAYLLVLVIGLKLVVDGFKFPGVDFHSAASPAFWIFWGCMALSIAFGFMPRKRKKKQPH